jgi:hypothetical protein
VPHVSHGAIATERLMFTPDARLMVVDHSFGAAIACLGFQPGAVLERAARGLPGCRWQGDESIGAPT